MAEKSVNSKVPRFTFHRNTAEIRLLRQECLGKDEEFIETVNKLEPKLKYLNEFLKENDPFSYKSNDPNESAETFAFKSQNLPLVNRNRATIKRLKYMQEKMKDKDDKIKFLEYSLEMTKKARDNFIETLMLHAETIAELKKELKDKDVLINHLCSNQDVNETDDLEHDDDSVPEQVVQLVNSFHVKTEPMDETESAEQTVNAQPELAAEEKRIEEEGKAALEELQREIKVENLDEFFNENSNFVDKTLTSTQGSINLIDSFSNCSNSATNEVDTSADQAETSFASVPCGLKKPIDYDEDEDEAGSSSR